MGPSGAGKTSILRAIAGLWNCGTGSITRFLPETEAAEMAPIDGDSRTASPREIFFMPQKPYMVLGALRDQLLYPTWTDLSNKVRNMQHYAWPPSVLLSGLCCIAATMARCRGRQPQAYTGDAAGLMQQSPGALIQRLLLLCVISVCIRGSTPSPPFFSAPKKPMVLLKRRRPLHSRSCRRRSSGSRSPQTRKWRRSWSGCGSRRSSRGFVLEKVTSRSLKAALCLPLAPA